MLHELLAALVGFPGELFPEDERKQAEDVDHLVKQLVPAVADYCVAKDLQLQDAEDKAQVRVAVPAEIADKAVQVQLAVDLITTALEHNIMARQQVRGGFKRLRERMSDYQLDSPLIQVYYATISKQFQHIIDEEDAADA